MKNRSAGRLSNVEKSVIHEIRALRNSTKSSLPESILNHPAHLVHHFLRASHGSVRLRMRPIARELGVGMRTLERAFVSHYGTTMAKCQRNIRLEFSCWMLSLSPPAKTSVIASLLGYEQVQDFNRFFRRHTGQSPLEWRANSVRAYSDKYR